MAEESRAPSGDLQRAEQGETVMLRASRRKWTLMLLVCVVGTAALVRAAFVEPRLIHLGGSLLCGMGVVVSGLSLIPGATYLRISPQGLTVRTLFLTYRLTWNEVENFRVRELSYRPGTPRSVGLDVRGRAPERRSPWPIVNRGSSGVLPDTYGQDPEHLARVLNALRQKYATDGGPSA